MANKTILTGWGRTSPSVAELLRPGAEEELTPLVLAPGGRGMIARGLGRSYGDPAQNAGGLVLDMTGLAAIGPVRDGYVTVEAGVSLHRLMRELVPEGWFPPVTPATRQVTVGGAVAADIHGRNHHADGSFGSHVTALDLLGADGVTRTLTPDDPDFWATVGGMGLTGVITKATIRLTPIETSRMIVNTWKCADLESVMTRLTQADLAHRYTAAWVDCLSRQGRGVVEGADHARQGAARSFRARGFEASPGFLPVGLLNRHTMGLVNRGLYATTKRESVQVRPLASFFHPLDRVGHWNRLYGPRGLVQYQFVVPMGAEQTLMKIVERIRRSHAASFQTVLKRFGPGSGGWLSFPTPGWSLALDFPTTTKGLAWLLDRLDELVAEAGGRVYLAKDSRLRPELLPVMYPGLAAFRERRRELDPRLVFQSDLARRLSL
ncbi:FAD-binding oxidoreductase [Herbidospora sp. NBRC 101105]|uniref:FAD-binding protein n=1 Tax=Herbidospora sp. NBRC 101105 TaxID=3032195 RepID=UPI0024A1CC5F|nr:FAD-binding oxidoreductase [Herbidospora sp. NBRC 101105]GLX95651.1 oxidoreductase [Herbidospora sp. NBRC 101105]